MKIGIANDHHGVELKQEVTKYLKDKGYNVIDYGTNSYESCDYPTLAFLLGKDLQIGHIDFGITLCMTGTGMSIALNKVKGVRCAKIISKEEAMLCRAHNDANAIALSAKIDKNIILEMIDIALNTEAPQEERHIRRVNLIKEFEKND